MKVVSDVKLHNQPVSVSFLWSRKERGLKLRQASRKTPSPLSV